MGPPSGDGGGATTSQTGDDSSGSSSGGSSWSIGGRYGETAAELLRNPRNFILSMLVGAIFGFVTAIYQFGLDLIGMGSSVMRDQGAVVYDQAGNLGSIVVDLFGRPIETLGDAAAGLGLAAPVAGTAVFAATAATTAALGWGVWRVLRAI